MTTPENNERTFIETTTDFPIIENLIDYVTERDPENLKNLLRSKVSGNQNIDLELLETAMQFGDEVHYEQVRMHDTPPAGQDKKPYTTHTLGAALIVADVMGEDVTTEALVLAILHDAMEDGKLTIPGTHKKRHVTEADIRQRFGEQGASLAKGVKMLSKVTDSVHDGEVKREKLTNQKYFSNIKRADEEHPEWGILIVKAADRMTNLLDPFRRLDPPQEEGLVYIAAHARKKTPRQSRIHQIRDTRDNLLPLLPSDSIIRAQTIKTMQVASLTLTPDFNPINWRQHLLQANIAA